MSRVGRPKGKTKVTMLVCLDETLRKEMASIESVLPVNWSALINHALFPAVQLMKEAIEELGKGDKADFDKVKYLLQGNVLEYLGTVHKGLDGVEKDIEKIKARSKKVKG